MGQVRHKSSRIILQAYKSQKPKISILETIGIERF